MQAIIRFPKVRELTGLSRSTIWRLYQQGSFPKPLQLGANSVGWDRASVESWLASRPAVQRISDHKEGAAQHARNKKPGAGANQQTDACYECANHASLKNLTE
jgi:prophage regulatory protein